MNDLQASSPVCDAYCFSSSCCRSYVENTYGGSDVYCMVAIIFVYCITEPLIVYIQYNVTGIKTKSLLIHDRERIVYTGFWCMSLYYKIYEPIVHQLAFRKYLE